jgi:hypothetical protein
MSAVLRSLQLDAENLWRSNPSMHRARWVTANYRCSGGLNARHACLNARADDAAPEADAMICSLVREWIRQRVEAQPAQ